MRQPQPAAFFLTATAAAALCLAGCATDGRTTAGSAGPATATATTTATSATAASTAAATPSAAALPPSPPAPAVPVTYTFPDGRLSFTHAAGWRVQHEQVSASPSVETATVLDESGQQRINIYYSQIGDGQPGPAARFVLETDPVPGLVGQSVPTPHSSFYADHVNGAVQYRMGLTPGLPVSPDGKVQNGLVMLGDRILTADVLFNGAQFPDDEAAKAWYWGADGQALKAVLMSFSYR